VAGSAVAVLDWHGEEVAALSEVEEPMFGALASRPGACKGVVLRPGLLPTPHAVTQEVVDEPLMAQVS